MNSASNSPVIPASWVVLILFGLICAPLITSHSESNYVYDEQSYHLPAVRQIETKWPRLDIATDSLSATAPGYHYLLAGVAQVVGSNTLTMRGVNFGLSAALLLVLLNRIEMKIAWTGIAVIAPLALNNFYIKSASWVVTDNVALLGLTLVLLNLSARESSAHLRASLLSGLTVLIRQNYAWLMFPLLIRVWLRRAEHGRSIVFRATVASMVPALVVGLLYLNWGGLVPARWTEAHEGARPFTLAPLAMILAIFGLMGPSYIWLATDRGWLELIRSKAAWVGGMLGGFIALIGPTCYSYEFGRWGGYIWEVVRFFPAPADRSLVLFAMSAWGGAVLAVAGELLAKTKGGHTAKMWSVVFGTWAVSALMNRQIFQRYFEPPVLILLIIWFIWMQRAPSSPLPRWKPMAGLALGQLLLTLATAYWNVFAPSG